MNGWAATRKLTHYTFRARPESAIARGTDAHPAFQRLLDFLFASKLAPIGLVQSLLDFLNLPLCQRIEFASCFLEGGIRYAAPNLTDTSFDTPGSCIVTP